MKLVHISDSHLGFSAYSRTDRSEGVNQREVDFYSAFRQAIDRTIEIRPDAVIHAGDLFDTVRPQNRAIDVALKQLLRLSQEGIETVMISGNHSTPRLRETGNIFRIFEHLPHIHPIHEPGIHREVLGDLTVTAIPHSGSPPLAQIVPEAEANKETRLNVLVLHAGILGSDVYRMDEFNEQSVPQESIPPGFDYVALGHYHRHSEVAKNVFYSGSTERLGFGEISHAKGILEVDLESKSVKFHELRTRGMLDIESIEATDLTSSEILSEARERMSATDIEDKIVRLAVKNVRPDAYRSLEMQSLKRFGEAAMHFELKVERVDPEGRREAPDTQIGSLAHEFGRYLSSLEMPQEKRLRLAEMGMHYFEEDEE